MSSLSGAVLLGLAYSERCNRLVECHPGLVNYLEVPFELLEHDPTVRDKVHPTPVVLHCASLSIAGTRRADNATFAALRRWVKETNTPWLGEHLSFVMADRDLIGGPADEYAPGEPYNLGYTVSPPMNDATLQSVVEYHDDSERRLGIPVILENAPIYFDLPNSTMSQFEFLRELCDRSRINLLLDLSHFLITCRNTNCLPVQEIGKLPLERVVEVHLSGLSTESKAHWDDHASLASPEIFDLLGRVLERAAVRAVTLEYNWPVRFSDDVLMSEIEKARGVIRCTKSQMRQSTTRS